MQTISTTPMHLPVETDSLSPMNLGFVEQHPKREWFVVERFSAVVVPFRDALKSALKRSTTNLTPEGSWSQCAPKGAQASHEPVHGNGRPSHFVLSPAAGERRSADRAMAPRWDLLSPW